jgi:hypothetical protein
MEHMEQYQQIIHIIALTLGISWASGINLYASMLMLGLLGAVGYIDLPAGLEILSDPLVISAAGLMYAVEFFADKMPGVDSTWDGLHTFIRIPAGAVLAAGAVSEVGPAAQLAAAIVGGTIATGAHFTKAGSRLLINTSPEPATNWAASITEDAAVIGGLWMALSHPPLSIALALVFIALMIWLLPRLWRAIMRVFGRLGQWLSQASVLPLAVHSEPLRRLSSGNAN